MLYPFLRVIFRMIFRTVFRLRVIGIENVPDEGAVVLCANHISLWDPPIMGTPLNRRVYYMAKAELFRIPLLGSIITQLGAFPVKRGGVSKESIRMAVQLLQEGKMLGIFPQGSRSNTSGIGKKGAASLAIKAGAAVIPVAIVGRYSPFRRMKIAYGKPLDISPYAGGSSEQLELATAAIMDAITRLLQENQP